MSKSGIEKRGFDKDEFMRLLNKYGKTGLAAGVLAAGVGTWASRAKAKKQREDSHDINGQKNSIEVQIHKGKFLEGLPTPEEFQKSQVSSVLSGEKVASDRKIDFFAKRASVKQDDKSSSAGEKKDSAKTDNGEVKEKPVVIRDGSGRFTSPTDPVGVAEEKTAGYDVWDNLVDTFAHPIDTAKGVWDAASTRPVATTAGAVASIVVAAKIVDAVRKAHERSSKRRLEASRAKYVDILQGGEKSAETKPGFRDSDNILSLLGGVGGHAFVIPMALSALIVNRIIKQRKEEKKKEKMESDSFPDEPYIVYKTYGGAENKISPDSALASMAVKRAMIEYIESLPAEKSAEIIPSYNGAVDRAISLMYDPDNNEHLLNMVKGHVSGGVSPEDAFKKMLSLRDKLQYGLIFRTNEFKRKLLADKRFSDLIMSRFNDDRFKDSFGKYREQIISDEVGRTFRKGSPLHKIVTQFSKGTFNDQLQKSLAGGKTDTQAKS